MAEITEELRVLVTAEVDKAIKNLNQLDRKTKKTESGFEKLGKAIGSALLVKAAVDFGKAGVKAAEDARQKFNLLKTTIDTTGAAAWTNADAMAGMAKELSDATNYSVSEIENMQTVLLGFKNITGDTFKEASGAIMDMATVMGMDLKSAVQTVGKALDDPINGIDSLKRQGFAFTDSQKSMLKAMVKTGDQAGAQKIILEELASTYGGAAQAAQTSFAKFEHSMDDLQEAVGNALTPMLTEIAEEAVNLLEKFNSLDAGTQRVIITATGLAAATPAVITALGGIKTALVALGATAPQLVAIGAGIAAITAISTKIVNSRNAFKDLTAEIAKTRTSTNALLDSYADGNGAKKLDEETTKKLIDLYPQLAGKIDAYSTSVNDAKKAVENLVNQKLLDAETSGIKKYLKHMESISELQIKVNEAAASNNRLDQQYAKERQEQVNAQLAQAEKERDAINERLKNLNKMLTYDGKIIDIPVEIKTDPKSIKNGLESSDSDIKKAWQEWLSKILKVDQSLFKTGEEAANIYIDGLERSLENAEGVSEILGKKFSATDIIDSQMSEIESNINKLLNIKSPLIDSVFNLEELKQEGTALNALYKDWQKLQDAKATSVIKDLQKQIDDLSKSELQLYLETNKLLDAPPEKIKEIGRLLDELNYKSLDELSDKIGFLAEKSLRELDIVGNKSAKVIGNLISQLSEISFDAVLTGFEELGRALGEGKDAAESMRAALVATAKEMLDQLPTAFMQAGLKLISQGEIGMGLAFVATGLGTGFVKGFVDGRTSSSSKANALGGVYGADDYAAFAKGGTFTNAIVTSPTFFKFAKGSGFGTGLMGEAGPEAVMPLTRSADGSLGVTASGIGGNVEVNIPVTVYSDEPVEVKDTTDENGQRKIEIMVGSMINRHLSDGSADRALKSRYGLKVQGV